MREREWFVGAQEADGAEEGDNEMPPKMDDGERSELLNQFSFYQAMPALDGGPGEFPEQGDGGEGPGMFDKIPPNDKEFEANLERELAEDNTVENDDDAEVESMFGQTEFPSERVMGEIDEGLNGMYHEFVSDQRDSEGEPDMDTNEQGFTPEDLAVQFFNSPGDPEAGMQEVDWSDRDFLKVYI